MTNPDPMAGWLKAMKQMGEQAKVEHQCEWWDVMFQNRQYCKTNASVTYMNMWWCVKHAKLVKDGKRWGI